MGPSSAESGREDSAPGSSAARAGAAAAGHAAVDFAAEYQRAYRVLWVIAAGVLGRSAGAEDVVQEAALLALGKIDQFEPDTHFAAWMAKIVRFVALNQLRKQTRGKSTATLDENDVRDRSGTPPQLRLGPRGQVPADQVSFDDDLMHALGTLSEVARACLLLRTLEGLDYAEIARVLDIPEGTAMSHVHRSRMRLREQLLAREGFAGRQPAGTTTTTTTQEGHR